VNLSRYLKRLVSGDHAATDHVASLRSIVVWIFIALVALFLTHPADSPLGAGDTPVPWPAELGLGLDGSLIVN
jgi:hypothetical protein